MNELELTVKVPAEPVWETPDFNEETLNCEVAAYAGGEYGEDRQ